MLINKFINVDELDDVLSNNGKLELVQGILNAMARLKDFYRTLIGMIKSY
jgi:hypothetical protein